jgi:uncharacterized protein YdeI (YjbR/CyaY-like superfamily)
MKPIFFPTPSKLRSWLEKHHGDAAELWVGFYKKDSGRPSITWPESVDQALCFGWIDGIRKSVDRTSYVIRFTPRKPGSTWSAINIKRAKELAAQGLMSAAGLRAFEKRSDEKSAVYSYEQRKTAELDPAQQQQFRANRRAWNFFQEQPPGYRRIAIYWVVSAKKQETRLSRLATLIACSERQERIGPLARTKKST